MYNNDPKYMNPPEAGLASLLASRGRNGDSVLVHMAPEELQGLQGLAAAHGGKLSVNPETGLYEASFLKKILPMIAGATLNAFVPGFGNFASRIGFGSQALGTAMIVGGATGLIEGDLKKGLMAGLGAYSGATLAEGLKAASVAGQPAEAAATVAPAAETAKASQAVEAARGTLGATADATRLSDVGGVFNPKMTTPPAISGISIKPVDYTPYTPPPPTPSIMGGISALMRPEGRSAFMGAMGGGFQSPLAQNLSKYAVMTGVADALTPQPKAMPMGGGASEDIVYIPGGFNPKYGTSRDEPYQLPGRYYKRTPQGLVPYNPFQLAPGARGFAEGGSVQSPMQGPIKVAPYAMPTEDPNVLATRAYIEELNRRARNPVVGAYPGGGGGGGGLGAYGTPGTYQPGSGGISGGGDSTGGGLGAIAGGIAANYLINKGIGAGVDYLRDKFGGEETPELDADLQEMTKVGGDVSTPLTSYAAGALGAISPFTGQPNVPELGKVTVEPVSYEGETQVVQEDFAPTQEVQSASSSVPFTSTALGALTAASPFMDVSPLPPTKTTVEPVSYEGEEMVVREDPTVTQQVEPAAATPATSAIPYTLGALNALSPFAAAPSAIPVVGEPVYDVMGNVTGFKYPDGTIEPVEGYERQPEQLDADLQAQTQVGGDLSVPLSALSAVSPFAAPATTAVSSIGEPVYDALGEVTGFKYPDGTIESVENYAREPEVLDADLQTQTQVGGDMSAPLSSYLSAGASGLAGLANLGSATSTGLTSIIPLDPATGVVQTFLSPGSSAAANAAAAESAKAAGAEVAGAGAGTGAASKIIPGLQAALGLYEAYKGIESGKEGRAALGGFGAGAGIATLAGLPSGFGALAAAGPIGLAAAAIAAIGASMVNTKEQGDVALRNYWKAVDQGRGLASAPPEELAEGFINFYRTNKNNFAGQEKYGRKGNEDFLYDMTQVVNKAVTEGQVSKDAKPEEIYQKVVQPWLNSMGSGPQDEDARRIQDFMMTDLIYNFMLGRPISNAQVKGDKNYKIVSDKPVYAGNPPPLLGQLEQAREQALTQGVRGQDLAEFLRTGQVGIPAAVNPFAEIMADEGQRVTSLPQRREEDFISSTMPVKPPREPGYELPPVGNLTPLPFEEPVGPTPLSLPEEPPFDPMRGVSLGDRIPVEATTPVPEEPYYAPTFTEPFYADESGFVPQAPPEQFTPSIEVFNWPDGTQRPYPPPYEIAPVEATTPIPEEPYYTPEYDRFNPFAEDYASMPFERMYRYAGGGAIGEDYNFGFSGGGKMPTEYLAGGKLLKGPGDGMSDDIPAVIRGKGVQRAALADGEFVVPADVVSHLGNGSTNAGAKKLYQMMARIRQARTGKSRQAPAVETDRYLPA